MIDNIKVLESVLVYSCDLENAPFIQNGRVSVKMTLDEFSNALISSGITVSRRVILPLYDWVSTNYGVILSPRKFSNGSYTNKSSFALDIYKTFKAVDAENSSHPGIRAVVEHYSNVGLPGMDPSSAVDACLHNAALMKSKILALGGCVPSVELSEGKELIEAELKYCLDLLQGVC